MQGDTERNAHCIAPIMSIDISKSARQQAVASIQRYFLEHMDERIGNVAAEGLLNFFLKEVGPSVYNQAVADAQSRLQARVMELDIEVHEDEFPYWTNARRPAGKRAP
jgi:uncharacterized protein (DUF2164 family)